MAPRVRFGLFDFDPGTGELRREGVAVRLQAQPAQVLRILIDAGGEVVTREALREAVWGSEVNVDFDRGLNYCVSQIRTALGDTADSPRFIRTIPKRGYQFIAPLAATPAEPAQKQQQRFPRRTLAAAGLSGAAALAGFAWLRPSPLPRIAVVRFDNESGDPAMASYATTVTDSLIGELTARTAGRHGIIGNAAILWRPRKERNLREIATALDAKYIVLGQIQKGEDGARVLAHLIRMPEQTHLRVARSSLRDATKAAEYIAGVFAATLSASGSH